MYTNCIWKHKVHCTNQKNLNILGLVNFPLFVEGGGVKWAKSALLILWMTPKPRHRNVTFRTKIIGFNKWWNLSFDFTSVANQVFRSACYHNKHHQVKYQDTGVSTAHWYHTGLQCQGTMVQTPGVRKNVSLLFLSCNLIIAIYLRINSWLCKVIDSWID